MTREELLRYGKEYLHDLETACCKIGELHLNFVRESIKALEQETVSREVYDHEYLLRKELDFKLAKLDDVLDKIRAEMVDLGQRTMNDNRANGIWTCVDIIDKYKAESENKE